MSREDFLERIRNMDPEEHERTTKVADAKNPSFAKKLNRKSKIKNIMNVAKTLGIGETFYSSSGAGGRESNREPIHHHGGSHAQTHHAPRHEPKSRGFSVYDINEVDIANARDYYSDIDGKGDR